MFPTYKELKYFGYLTVDIKQPELPLLLLYSFTTEYLCKVILLILEAINMLLVHWGQERRWKSRHFWEKKKV